MKKLIQVIIFNLFSLSLFSQTTYYVSPSGNDSNIGTSSSSPWKTSSQVSSVTLQPGDSVLFQRGGAWREALLIDESGTSSARIYYGSYGTGNNPKILGSDVEKSWTATGTTNIWQGSGSYSDPRALGSYASQLFFMKNDSVTWGTFQTYTSDFANLTKEYDWTYNSNTIYIYATSDPGVLYDSVEVPQRTNCVYMADNNPESYITWDGIDLHFSGQNGFNCGYPAVYNTTDLTIKNCEISYIGEIGSGHAYGIQTWISNFLVDNCTFSDCGRRAVSFATYSSEGRDSMTIQNIVIRNSIFKRGWHTTALDLESGRTGDSIINIYFYNNIIDDGDLGSNCASYRSNQIFIQEYDGHINDVYIVNNVFIEASGRNLLIEGGDTVHVWFNTVVGHNSNTFGTSIYSNISFNYSVHNDYRNNILYSNWPNDGTDDWGVLMQHTPSVYINCDYNLYYQENIDHSHNGFTGGLNGYYSTDQWSTYKSDNPTLDVNSPTPANPNFVTLYEDMHLSSGSPAAGAGTSVSITFTDPEGNSVTLGAYDIEGNSRPASPSIGAYEYTEAPTVTTTSVSSISYNTATGGGNVTSDNGHSVTARGVCWSTSSNPTISDSHTSDGTGTGSFTSSITGLSEGTTYHVRAYATNSEGTAYGSDITFTTLSHGSVPVQHKIKHNGKIIKNGNFIIIYKP